MNGSKEANIPDNVPSHLIFDFDMFEGPEVTGCPRDSLLSLFEKPDIFYTPRHGGHWVVTRQRPAVEMLDMTDIFSSDPTVSGPETVTTAIKRIPLDVDPPAHTGYRKILSTMLSPRAVRGWEPMIRSHARALIDGVLRKRSCEFLGDVAQRYPVEIFLRLLGISVDRKTQFVAWIDEMFRTPDPVTAQQASLRVASVIGEEIADRRRKPGDDLISRLLEERFEDRPLTEDELIGMSVLLFIGGLDTVVALLSFIILFLAEHPEHRAQLVKNPERIPNAIEEMARRQSITLHFRFITRDTDLYGIKFKAKERVLLMHALYGVDDREVSDPLSVDFNRPVSRHTAFGSGPHRCVGAHLARLELKIFLEEWLASIPDFAPEDAAKIDFRGGKILQPHRLPLRWPASAGTAGTKMDAAG